VVAGSIVAAARGGYGDLVELLLEHRADAKEFDEFLAIEYAIIAEHERMFRTLLRYGATTPTTTQREAIKILAIVTRAWSILAYVDSLPVEKPCLMRTCVTSLLMGLVTGHWSVDACPTA